MQVDLLLIGTGAITALPLLALASGAQKTPLQLIGVLQFLTPTLTTLLGLLAGEPVSRGEAVSYIFICSGIAIFLLAPIRKLIDRHGIQ